ncbi:MAG: hypothetical protein AB1716_01050 [Planctomycetota bacterium]
MGAFLVRHVDLDSGVELARFAAPNLLAYEGLGTVLRQIFPPYEAPLDFTLGVSGTTLRARDSRPQTGLQDLVSFERKLTYALCVDVNANEGGCHTDALRNAFGYQRRAVTFTAALEADGGQIVTPEYTFPNLLPWQPAGEWDDPTTPQTIEPDPPAWDSEGWEPVHGYPWQRPTIKGDQSRNTPSYFDPWAPDHSLDWLAADPHRIGGFPISLAWIADTARQQLVAAATFAAPVLLRPGTALFIKYQARIFCR